MTRETLVLTEKIKQVFYPSQTASGEEIADAIIAALPTAVATAVKDQLTSKLA